MRRTVYWLSVVIFSTTLGFFGCKSDTAKELNQQQAQVLEFEKNKAKSFIYRGNKKIKLKNLLKDHAEYSAGMMFEDGNNLQMRPNSELIPGKRYSIKINSNLRVNMKTHKVEKLKAKKTKQLEDGNENFIPFNKRKKKIKNGEEQVQQSPSCWSNGDNGTQVVVVYKTDYKTQAYSCWSAGESGPWDGLTDSQAGVDDVQNAAVVRRGISFYVKDKAQTWTVNDVDVLSPAPHGGSRSSVSWNVSLVGDEFKIDPPADAPVGDYRVQLGSNTLNFVTVYVIFDPYALQTAGYLTNDEMKSWAYDDYAHNASEIGDRRLDQVCEGPGPYPYSSFSNTLYCYRTRKAVGETSSNNAEPCNPSTDSGVFGQRITEAAISVHGNDVDDDVEAALNIAQIAGQRITWASYSGFYGQDGGAVNTFENILYGGDRAVLGPTDQSGSGWNTQATGGTVHNKPNVTFLKQLDVATMKAMVAGKGYTNRLDQIDGTHTEDTYGGASFDPTPVAEAYVLPLGNCFNFSTFYTIMMRSIGIPSRNGHGMRGAGWWSSFHAWSEALLASDNYNSPSMTLNRWWVTDANDRYARDVTNRAAHLEGRFAPLRIGGLTDYMFNGAGSVGGHGFIPNLDGIPCCDNCPEATQNCTYTSNIYITQYSAYNANKMNTWNDNFETMGQGGWLGWWTFSSDISRDLGRTGADYTETYGYALNDTMGWDSSGNDLFTPVISGRADLSVTELPMGTSQLGVVQTLSAWFVQVPSTGEDAVELQITQNNDRVKFFATAGACPHRGNDADYRYGIVADVGPTDYAIVPTNGENFVCVMVTGVALNHPNGTQLSSWDHLMYSQESAIFTIAATAAAGPIVTWESPDGVEVKETEVIVASAVQQDYCITEWSAKVDDVIQETHPLSCVSSYTANYTYTSNIDDVALVEICFKDQNGDENCKGKNLTTRACANFGLWSSDFDTYDMDKWSSVRDWKMAKPDGEVCTGGDFCAFTGISATQAAYSTLKTDPINMFCADDIMIEFDYKINAGALKLEMSLDDEATWATLLNDVGQKDWNTLRLNMDASVDTWATNVKFRFYSEDGDEALVDNFKVVAMAADCTGVTCTGQNEICRGGACTCEHGYEDLGSGCVAVNLCSGVSCTGYGESGTCDPFNGKCECDTGYISWKGECACDPLTNHGCPAGETCEYMLGDVYCYPNTGANGAFEACDDSIPLDCVDGYYCSTKGSYCQPFCTSNADCPPAHPTCYKFLQGGSTPAVYGTCSNQ